MPNIIVTQHASARYVERVNPRLTQAEAETAILASVRAIECAVGFHARIIRLGCGAKLVIERGRVLTMLPADCGRTGGHSRGVGA